MALPGRPSHACVACRSKKIKCDGSLPECNRCITKGIQCPGYTRSASVATKSRGSASLLPPYTRPDGYSLPPSVPADLGDQAIARFFHDYVEPTCNSSVPGGYLNFLYDVCHLGADQDRWFYEGLRAVACVNTANQLHHAALHTRAQVHYGNALASVNQALRVPELAIKDTVLATIILISLYEVLAKDAHEPFLWDSHHRGRLLLLKLRGPKQLETPVGRMMFRTSYTQMQTAYLARCWKPDDTMPFPLRNPTPAAITQFPLVPIARPMQQVIAFYSSAIPCIHSADPTPGQLHAILDRLPVIDAVLQDWAAGTPAVWAFKTVSVSPAFRAKRLSVAFPDWLRDVHSYVDLRVVVVWNVYRSGRLFIYHAALLALDRLMKMYLPDSALAGLLSRKVQYETVVSMIADDICATVPYCLNQVKHLPEQAADYQPVALGGFLLLWPFYVLKSRVRMSEQMASFVGGVLVFIRDVLGIQRAQLALEYSSSPRTFYAELFKESMAQVGCF